MILAGHASMGITLSAELTKGYVQSAHGLGIELDSVCPYQGPLGHAQRDVNAANVNRSGSCI